MDINKEGWKKFWEDPNLNCGHTDGKASAYNAGDQGSIPGLGRSPGEGNGNPLQHPCLENPMDGGSWQATVHGVAKSQTRLSNFTSLHKITAMVQGFSTRAILHPLPAQERKWKCESLSHVRLFATRLLFARSPPGSSVHGILQARIPESRASPFLQGIFPTQGSNLSLLHCRRFFTIWAPREGSEARDAAQHPPKHRTALRYYK